jgi:hypothetical protein
MLGDDLDTGVRRERSGASGLRESYIYSDEKDPRVKYAVEIRMSPSEFAQHDFELSFSSSALAVAWQLRLIKGVVHHHGKTSSVERLVVIHGLGSESEGEEWKQGRLVFASSWRKLIWSPILVFLENQETLFCQGTLTRDRKFGRKSTSSFRTDTAAASLLHFATIKKNGHRNLKVGTADIFSVSL